MLKGNEKQTEHTEKQVKEYCIKNGMTEEQFKKYLAAGFSISEIYNSAKDIISKCGALDGSEVFNAKLANEFGEDKTNFLWFPYIPIGDYTVLMADGGTGKTIFCCGIAATISQGKPLPSEITGNLPCNTLIISAEDRGELLKRRLAAAGADLKKVYILDCMDSVGLNFTDKYNDFVQLIKRYSPKLVIVDPWHAFLGADIDINRVNAVRPVFQRLANVAKTCNCGMVLVSDITKCKQVKSINSAAGSAMRVIFSEEPGEPNMRVVVHTKSNYAAAGQSVKYTINAKGGCEWSDFGEVTGQAIGKGRQYAKR